jgi:ElaB/YqjD/DUF883 family membrane-anchored ribosome-binding protein
MGEDPGAVGTRALDESGVPPRTTTADAPAAAAQPTPDTPEEMRAEIERTREELGDTVAALAEKTDVKARAKDKVAEVKSTVTDKKTELMGRARETSPEGATSAATQVKTKAQDNPVPTAALAAFVGGFLFGRLTKRR